MHHYYCTAAGHSPLFLWYYTDDQIAALKAENIANHTGELSEYIEARISETKDAFKNIMDQVQRSMKHLIIKRKWTAFVKFVLNRITMYMKLKNWLYRLNF